MDFVTKFRVLINRKDKSYNLILVIINQLTKIIYYKLVKIIINVPDLAIVIIDIIVRYYSLFNFIIIN